MSTHYIAIAGMHGCLPNSCGSYESIGDAVDGVASLHNLGKRRTSLLRRDCYLELNLHRDGNEYIEITDCDCDHPETHNDV